MFLEHFKSSGTKHMMRGLIVHKLSMGKRRKILDDEFHVFIFTSFICAASLLA